MTSCKFLRRLPLILVMMVLASVLPGCGYTLRGKVVRGDVSGIELVHQIDPRMKAPGIANAEVRVHRDPNTLNRRLAGQDRTNTAGEFAMRVGEFGAGWMQEQWLVQAMSPGFQNTEALTKLPGKGSKWMLLITLAPGTATPIDQSPDYMQDFERYR